MWPLISTFLVIFIAELGDKTQLLTIGFASKYPLWEVMTAVGVATGVLMALAVSLGEIVTVLIPAGYLQFLAATLFLYFGITTIIGKERTEQSKIGKAGSSFWLIFSAFILAEMGDKTQLAAFALTAKYGSPFLIWLGATAGMIGANIIGGLAGKIMHTRFSAKSIDWVSGLVFVAFGLWTLGELFVW